MKRLFWLLFGIGTSIALVAFGLSDNIPNYFFNIFLGLSTNIFGLIITIFFAQKYIDENERKNRKVSEKDEIIRRDRIMRQLIELYLEGYASIAIPNKRSVSEVHINAADDDEFAFEDLAGMYEPSLMIQKKGVRPSIEIFYENEYKLAKYVMDVIENVDFEFYPELLNTLMAFYETYIKSDEKDMVLWPLTIDNADNKKLVIAAMSEMIKDEKQDWLTQDAQGTLDGNVMKSYVALYSKVRAERRLIAKYMQEIKNMKCDMPL